MLEKRQPVAMGGGGRPGFLRDVKCAHTCKIHNPHAHGVCIIYTYVLVKVPARVLYGNYWAQGKFEKVM